MSRYSSYDDVYAVCPYYKGSTETDVRCEGLERGQCIIVRFAGRTAKNGYRMRFCDSMQGYRECPLAKARE